MTLNTLPEELTKDTRNRIAELHAVAESAGISFSDNPEFLLMLARVFTFSHFVAKGCIRNPEILYSLLQSKDLGRSYSHDEYIKKLHSACSGVSDTDGLTSVLRQFRLREMIRIAWRDLASEADLSETMADLSALAESCINQAFSYLYKKLC